MEDEFRLKHATNLLVVEKPDNSGEFYMSITNKWGDEEAIYLTKDEAKKLVQFLQNHV